MNQNMAKEDVNYIISIKIVDININIFAHIMLHKIFKVIRQKMDLIKYNVY